MGLIIKTSSDAASVEVRVASKFTLERSFTFIQQLICNVLSMIAEGEGVHWKTQHDFSSGKVYFLNQKFKCSSDVVRSSLRFTRTVFVAWLFKYWVKIEYYISKCLRNKPVCKSWIESKQKAHNAKDGTYPGKHVTPAVLLHWPSAWLCMCRRIASLYEPCACIVEV